MPVPLQRTMATLSITSLSTTSSSSSTETIREEQVGARRSSRATGGIDIELPGFVKVGPNRFLNPNFMHYGTPPTQASSGNTPVPPVIRSYRPELEQGPSSSGTGANSDNNAALVPSPTLILTSHSSTSSVSTEPADDEDDDAAPQINPVNPRRRYYRQNSSLSSSSSGSFGRMHSWVGTGLFLVGFWRIRREEVDVAKDGARRSGFHATAFHAPPTHEERLRVARRAGGVGGALLGSFMMVVGKDREEVREAANMMKQRLPAEQSLPAINEAPREEEEEVETETEEEADAERRERTVRVIEDSETEVDDLVSTDDEDYESGFISLQRNGLVLSGEIILVLFLVCFCGCFYYWTCSFQYGQLLPKLSLLWV